MKKVLISILVVVLAVTLFGATALAAGSASDDVEITNAVDGSGNAVEYTEAETSVPWLTEEIAAPIIGSVTPADIQVLWQRDITAETLPVTLTFTVNNFDGKTGWVFHWNGSAWEIISSGTCPTLTGTFSDLSPVAIVVQKAASGSSTGGNTSPATGQPVGLYLSFGIMAAALCGAWAVSKKRA